jgi:hypothetical protein
VEVEMILREVREQRDGDARAGQALLDDADRRGLDRAGREALPDEVGSVTGSGVVRPVDSTSRGGSPIPSVPITPQRRPSRLSACAVHQAVEVLPLVPVVATSSNVSLGAP